MKKGAEKMREAAMHVKVRNETYGGYNEMTQWWQEAIRSLDLSAILSEQKEETQG